VGYESRKAKYLVPDLGLLSGILGGHTLRKNYESLIFCTRPFRNVKRGMSFMKYTPLDN